MTMREMILNGWPIMTVLLLMSIGSITVLLDRILVFRAARTDNRNFVINVLRTLDLQGRDAALKVSARYPFPIAAVVTAILAAPDNRPARERALQHALQKEIHHLESYVVVLGTIAGTAPFVGLFGTIWGIIKAFRNIAITGGGGFDVVAAGIAEALITTAGGLIVAIPALVAFNGCGRYLQRLSQHIELAVFDLLEKLEPVGEEAGTHAGFRLE